MVRRVVVAAQVHVHLCGGGVSGISDGIVVSVAAAWEEFARRMCSRPTLRFVGMDGGATAAGEDMGTLFAMFLLLMLMLCVETRRHSVLLLRRCPRRSLSAQRLRDPQRYPN